jgi:hypothetical protein
MTADTSTTETTGTDTGTETAATEAAATETGTGESTAETQAAQTTDETAEAKATRLETENARLRRENASERVSAKEQAAEEARTELLATLTKALGGETGDEAPTVEQLATQLTEQTTKTEAAAAIARDTQAELVVWQNATDLKVDPKALTDSRAFEKAIKDLDPTDDAFAEKVKEAAQEAVKNNPKLGAAQAAGKSGTELNGGSGEGATTQDQFNQMTGAERNQLAQTNPTLYARLSGRE